MYKKILLPTDGSAYADEEIERAIKLLADDGEIIDPMLKRLTRVCVLKLKILSITWLKNFLTM